MTKPDLKRLRELEQKADNAPWSVAEARRAWGMASDNAAFLVEARNALPALLDYVERLEELLKEAQWHLHEHIEGCLFCGEDVVVDGEAKPHDCWYNDYKQWLANEDPSE